MPINMNIAYKKKKKVKLKRKPRQEYALLKTGKRGRPKRLEIYQRIKGKVRHTVRPHIRKLLLKDHTKIILPKNRIWNPATEQLNRKSTVFQRNGKLKSQFINKVVLVDNLLVDKFKPKHRDTYDDAEKWKHTMNQVCDTFYVDVPEDLMGMEGYLNLRDRLPHEFKRWLRRKGGFIYRITSEGIYSNPGKPEDGLRQLRVSTKRRVIIRADQVKKTLDDITKELILKTEEKETEGSGWRIEKVTRHMVEICVYTNLGGSSYINLPSWFDSRNAVINPQNTQDDKCFWWCFVIYEFYVKQKLIKHHAGRVYGKNINKGRYQKLFNQGHKLETNFKGIDFPVRLSDIEKFEKQNIQYCVNVFAYVDQNDKWDEYDMDWAIFKGPCGIKNIYSSKNDITVVGMENIDLLLIEKDGKQHYALINKLSALVSANKSNHHGKVYICRNCCNVKTSQKALNNHYPKCCKFESLQTIMPTEDYRIKFKDFVKESMADFICVADFEAFLKPIYGPSNKEEGSYTRKTHLHVPASFGYYIICKDGEIQRKRFKPKIYREEGKDIATQFVKQMQREAIKCFKLSQRYKDVKYIKWKPGEEAKHRKTKHCAQCKCQFTAKNKKVRHHDHLTGYFISSLCSNCNKKLRNRWYKLPVFIHNSCSYDSHFFVTAATKLSRRDPKIIPKNYQKFISMDFDSGFDTKIGVRFLDSYLFMKSSVSKLVKNLKDQDFKFPHTVNHLCKIYPKEVIMDLIDLFLEKGDYPYEHMSSYEVFNQDLNFTRKDFDDTLNGTSISEKGYQKYLKIKNALNLTKKYEWHDLYLYLDVLLLGDVIQNFRKLSMDGFKLDPCNNSFTMPNFVWSAMLKKTQAEVKPMTDQDMYLLVEEHIKGGISFISHRYAKANNPYMKKGYDPNKPNSYIIPWDMNSLYSAPMSEPLPIDNYEWVDPATFDMDALVRETRKNRLNKTEHLETTGYIIEVDWRYPKELHDLPGHRDFPLAVENKYILDEMLSPEQKRFKVKRCKSKKLIPDFGDPKDENRKRNYLCYHRNLEYYLSKGLILEKVRSIIKFDLEPWMKPWIDYCVDKRKKAKNDYEKQYFKDCMNLPYGKTLENVRSRCQFELTTDVKKVLRLASSLRWDGHIKYNDELRGIKKRKFEIKLDKPIAVGFVILELSKLLMQKFHYDYIAENYGLKAQLLFSDTDSLTYHIETEDIYKDMKKDLSRFDTSNYPTSHFLYSDKNKKQLYKFKDEAGGKIVLWFVGFRAKMYHYEIQDDDGKIIDKNTAKGVDKRCKNKLTGKDYLDNFNNYECNHRIKSSRIQSVNHVLSTVVYEKLGINSFDDKSYILPGGVEQLRHGHWRIAELQKHV